MPNKILKVEMSRRPDDGDQGVLTELPQCVTVFPRSSTWRFTALSLSLRRALMTC